ncbi:MAG: sulfur carrier protein ThiS [Flavisolibacter sp.]
MEITFNNRSQKIQEQCSVQIVINDLIGEKQKGIAVAVNETVVPKTEWNNYLLQPNDKVLVIKATQGG